MLAGVYYFPTDYGIDITELARALEERGYDSLFVCEHTHIPVSRRTPFPGGGEIPKRYAHTHDPFDEQTQDRHRHCADSATRPDCHCQISGQP